MPSEAAFIKSFSHLLFQDYLSIHSFAVALKKLTFIFALFYLASSIGYGFEAHYCLGQVTDVNLSWFETSCACDDVHEEKVSNCCDEREFFIQLDQEHQPVSLSVEDVCSKYMASPTYQVVQICDDFETETPLAINTNGPPRQIAHFKLNCAFVFYG